MSGRRASTSASQPQKESIDKCILGSPSQVAFRLAGLLGQRRSAGRRGEEWRGAGRRGEGESRA
eukprot:3938822-Rhodomonas_salina.1